VIWLAAGMALANAALGQFLAVITGLLRAYTGEHLVLRFRAALFRHVQRLSLLYHDIRGTSDSIYRIQYDAPSISYLTLDGLIPMVVATLTLIGMFVVTARIDGQLVIVAMVVAPILFGLTQAYKVRMRRPYQKSKELESYALSVVQEVLTAVRVVKAFGREESEQQRFVRQSGAGVRARVRIALAEGLLWAAISMTIAGGTAVVLFLGVNKVHAGVLTLGELLLVLAYLAQLYGQLNTLSSKLGTVQGSLVSARRAFELLDESPDVVDRHDAQPITRSRGEIAFRNLGFAYDGIHPVLKDVSYRIAPGARIGIAGRTGAGKSTLMSLVVRFYDPTEGQVLLDGVDLSAYRLADLRNQFAIVLQEPILFSTSIAENIAYARPDATLEEIEAAARAANAHDFITRLPEGYATRVGERGMRLSGGERQRISLARAFLKDAPILILDEPTSSVDVQTEASIMDAMERLMRGRTTLMIAHRLSTLKSCDTVLVLDQGRLVSSEGGTTRAQELIMAGPRPATSLPEHFDRS
jgi:ATP-binding cassette subfamily B protein